MRGIEVERSGMINMKIQKQVVLGEIEA